MSLKVVDVHIKIKNKVLFKNFNLSIKRGNFCTLMGPSGSGKSTLLSFILGSLTPSEFIFSGEIWLDNVLLNPQPIEKRGIGIMFQDPCLFPHLNVAENLAFGIRKYDHSGKRISNQEKKKIISKTLAQAHLKGMENHNPETLSGGEKTRVGLLRTLLSEPQALLLDEPFSKLDMELRNKFRKWVFTLLREKSIPVLLVTHDPEDIPTECEQVINLNHV